MKCSERVSLCKRSNLCPHCKILWASVEGRKAPTKKADPIIYWTRSHDRRMRRVIQEATA